MMPVLRSLYSLYVLVQRKLLLLYRMCVPEKREGLRKGKRILECSGIRNLSLILKAP